MCVGQIEQVNRRPLLQKTHLGWIVSFGLGKIPLTAGIAERVQRSHIAITKQDLHRQLTEFWRLEEYGSRQPLTKEEQIREEHFLRNVNRNSQGRFIVSLPIKEDKITQLGESRLLAMRRFHSLERKFHRQPDLRAEYSRFMAEYQALGHMRKIDISLDMDAPQFYLPHYAVTKESSSTTKLPIVFDGSCKTSTGVSLNDVLRMGLVVQQDLFSIIARFRAFQYTLNANVSKMYRQILMDSTQPTLQRILWRDYENKEVEMFELLTITYGTSTASFLATRCLSYLAEKEGQNYPLAATAIARDFYVDDLLSGADSLEEALTLRNQIICLLQRGCFQLRKWSSNAPELCEIFREIAVRIHY